MPKLTDSLDSFKLPGNYGFSATKIQDLGATEYTLVTVILDDSGSITSFRKEMTDCVKAIISACKYSPRADNLMIRLVTFSGRLVENHGFKLLSNCNPDDYDSVFSQGGSTALYDAVSNSLDATLAYSKSLASNEFSSNGIVIVITDGEDNVSSATANTVKDSFDKIMKSESLESLVSILVGVNVGSSSISNFLNSFKTTAGFTQYVELKDASDKKLAKLADFVSKSISSQSSALGTGGASSPIQATF